MSMQDNNQSSTMEGDDSEKATSTDRKELITRVRTEKHPLFLAVLNRDFQAIKKCVADGQEVNVLDPKAWSPLRTAARIGDPALIRLLLKLKADLKFDDQLPLVTAASWGHVEGLEVLLTTGKADISADFKWEVSPLACACREGRMKVVQTLVKHEVDVNLIDGTGNDPLIVAWERNQPEIAFYLVENGAVLKSVESWDLLANFPAAAYQISNGFAAHHGKMIAYKKMMNNGVLNAKDIKPAVRVPHETICTWLEKVPSALLILLDRLFTQTPIGAPVRSDMKGLKLRTQYPEKVEEWRPIEEPMLIELCPPDDDGVGGKAVLVRCLHQQSILQVSYFFVLVNSSLGMGLLSSESIQNTVHHTWTTVVQIRFVFDFVFHLLSMFTLFLWAVITMQQNEHAGIAMFAWVCLLFLTVGDLLHFLRIHDYYHKVQKRSDLYWTWAQHAGFDVITFVRIAVGFVALVMTLAGQIWVEGHVEKSYRLALSVAALMQCLQVFKYLRGMEIFGTTMIPILEAILGAWIFFIPWVFALFALSHSTASMGGNIWKHFLGHFFLITLQKWNSDAEDSVDTDSFKTVVGILNYVSATCLSLIFYNAIIPVIMERFEFQREKRFQMFIRERVLLCFKYTIMGGYVSLAPVEAFLHKVLPQFFAHLPKKGILWTSETMDFRRTYDSRLRWMEACMKDKIKTAHNKAQELIDEMDFDLSQNLEKTHLVIEQYRAKLTKSVKREEKKLKASMSQANFEEIEAIANRERAVDSVYIRNVDQDWMHEGDADAIALRGSIAEVVNAEEDALQPHQALDAKAMARERIAAQKAAKKGGKGSLSGGESSRATSKD